MNRLLKLGFLASTLILASSFPIHAEPPLRLEVATSLSDNPTAVRLRVVNERPWDQTLANPRYPYPFQSGLTNRLPFDIQRFDGQSWADSNEVVSMYSEPTMFLTIFSGKTLTFDLRIAKPGQYRVCVWHLINPDYFADQKHSPRYGSVFSRTFEVVAQGPLLAGFAPAVNWLL